MAVRDRKTEIQFIKMGRGGAGFPNESNPGRLQCSWRTTPEGVTKKASLDRGVGFIGRADQGGRFVEDDGDGHVREHLGEVPFVLKGVEEGAVGHARQNLDRDTTGDVNAAESKDF